MKLNDLFTRAVITAGPEEALAGIALRMQEYNVGTVVIVEDGRPVGIITDRDLALALGARGLSPQAPAREVMTRHVLAVPEDTGVFTATRFIQDRKVRRLPVVDRDRPRRRPGEPRRPAALAGAGAVQPRRGHRARGASQVSGPPAAPGE